MSVFTDGLVAQAWLTFGLVRETFWLSKNHPVWLRFFLIRSIFAVHEPCMSYLPLSISVAKYLPKVILLRLYQILFAKCKRILDFHGKGRPVTDCPLGLCSQKRTLCLVLLSLQNSLELGLFLVLVKLAFSCTVTSHY